MLELRKGSKTEYLMPPASRMAYCWGVLLNAKMVKAMPARNRIACKEQENHYGYFICKLYLKTVSRIMT